MPVVAFHRMEVWRVVVIRVEDEFDAVLGNTLDPRHAPFPTWPGSWPPGELLVDVCALPLVNDTLIGHFWKQAIVKMSEPAVQEASCRLSGSPGACRPGGGRSDGTAHEGPEGQRLLGGALGSVPRVIWGLVG